MVMYSASIFPKGDDKHPDGHRFGSAQGRTVDVFRTFLAVMWMLAKLYTHVESVLKIPFAKAAGMKSAANTYASK
jgi:hypothetical protein